jgi:ubiquinone/menaquinone biosynthesis C-methylase UbiE
VERGRGKRDDEDVFVALAEDERAERFLGHADGLLVEMFTPQEKGTILQLGASTPALTTGIIEQTGKQARLVVVDPRLPMLDAVRFKVGDQFSGRVFFNSKLDWGRLPFDDEVFVSVVSNLFWLDTPDREGFLVDIYRVLHHAGALLLTTYMQGSFRQLYDLFAETLLKFDVLHVLQALHADQGRLLDESGAVRMLEEHGFSMCRARTFEIPLSFEGAKDLLDSPLVRALWLPRFEEIGGDDSERILWHLRDAVDRYFAGRSMELTVMVGVLSGLK